LVKTLNATQNAVAEHGLQLHHLLHPDALFRGIVAVALQVNFLFAKIPIQKSDF